jgi:hypothetical protein
MADKDSREGMNILVLQPIRPSNPLALRERANALLARLPAANPGMCFDIRQDDAALEIPPHPSLYIRHATVRNYMLDRYLREEHDAVLWIDSDLIDYPADLPTRLAGVSKQLKEQCPRCGARLVAWLGADGYDCAECGNGWCAPEPDRLIVAPLVLLSPTSGWPGRFYDIGGFIEKGNRARMWPPYFEQQGAVIELDSVGCCYLAPAQLYRDRVRYSPPVTDYYVEHFSVMQEACKRGYRIYCLTTASAMHAWLPDYGLEPN